MEQVTPPLHRFDRRSSGLLMHVTSLPGPQASGDLGQGARRFVDFLAAAGQTWWQMLPVVPPDVHGSPYSSISSFAGSRHLISLEELKSLSIPGKEDSSLRAAYEGFVARPRQRLRADFERFCTEHVGWLPDFALFCALKERHGGKPWYQWSAGVRRREAVALQEAERALAEELRYHQFVQFLFDRQWQALRRYARKKRIGLIGDVPIFVAHDSVDVWCNQELFQLDKDGRAKRISGYPADAFSPQGQKWGHPQYEWDAHVKTGFRWWAARMGAVFRLFDAVRIDHFLGFSRVWSIPGGGKTATRGTWVDSPGRELLSAVREALGEHPIIAEDLGRLTPEAAKLRDDFGLPGMRIIQQGFGQEGWGDGYHRPHSFVRRSVVYTGTHDHQTTVGWYRSLDEKGKERVADYAGCDGEGDQRVHEALIRLAMGSVADTAIFPVQDVLGLDDRARMNTPGTIHNNWTWRVEEGALNDSVAGRLREWVDLFERAPRAMAGKAKRSRAGN